MKKLFIILGSFVALILAAIMIIPFVVDVDKYRPQIISAANERMNGSLELGKLSLSLWGQIRVEIGGLTVLDAHKNKVLSVKDAAFHVPFSSVFGGAPLLTLHMENPEVNVIKTAAGKMNVMTLMKENVVVTENGGNSPGATQAATPKTQASSVTLPAFVTNARLGLDILHANLLYKDEALKSETKVEDLNLVVKDLSLTRTTSMKLWANLKSNTEAVAKIEGPIKAEAELTPTVSGGKFMAAAVRMNVDLDDLVVRVGQMFLKDKGVKAQMDGELKLTEDQAEISKFAIHFFNAKMQMAGKISGLKAAEPVSQIKITADPIDLAPWSKLIPMLGEYQLAGTADFGAQASGPASKLDYSADLEVKGLTAKAPMLKAQPRLDAVLKIVTDKVETMRVTFTAPGNDLVAQGSLVSFKAPRFDFKIASQKGMDLDQLVDFPEPKAGGSKSDAGGSGGGSSEGGAQSAAVAKGEDRDALLDPMRKNPAMAAMSGTATVTIPFIKAMGIKMTDIGGKMSMRDLSVAIDSFGMKLWEGSIAMGAALAMKPKTPTYHFDAKVNGLDLKSAVTSKLQLFKNTVYGKATMKVEGSGASFNTVAALQNLKAKGTMKVEKATFASIDVGKMVSEGINKGLAKVGEKIPQAKGKSIKGLPNKETRYEFISSDFTIDGGKFKAPNFYAKSEPKAGVDLKGDTTVGMIDYSIKASWQVIDTYDLTNARDVSVEQAGVKVEHILAEGNDPVKFPVDVGGTVSDPKYSYTQVPEYFAKVALDNVTKAATGKAKSEAKKKVAEKVMEASKSAPAPVQKALQGLGKKLFGN